MARDHLGKDYITSEFARVVECSGGRILKIKYFFFFSYKFGFPSLPQELSLVNVKMLSLNEANKFNKFQLVIVVTPSFSILMYGSVLSMNCGYPEG